ncbi:MAG: enoyl-ACP reductase [Chromatiales bacterium]|nr:enoyl-ACP reductase [Chromatiales bacterium]
MGMLDGRCALLTGVATKHSIAWGITRSLAREGARIVLAYQNEKLKSRVEKLAAECNAEMILPCDVQNDAEIEELFRSLKQNWPKLDILVHSIAYAPREELNGEFLDHSTRDGFNTAHEISCYSLVALAQHARAMMKGGEGAMLTLSYLGAERVVPNYNVMGLAKASLEAAVRYLAVGLGKDGIRINAISAGPIKTLAASGIAGFREMLDYVEKNAPLCRNVSIEEVGDVAAFLCSEMARAITGEVIHVDSGYHLLGMHRTP